MSDEVSDEDWFGLDERPVARHDDLHVQQQGTETPHASQPSPVDDIADGHVSSGEDWNVAAIRDDGDPAVPQAAVVAVANLPAEAQPQEPLQAVVVVVEQNAQHRAADVASGTMATLAKFGVDASLPICKLAVCMFGDRASSSRLLTSGRSLASDSGFHGSKICQEICGLAHSAHNFMTSRLSDVISRVTSGMGRHMEGALRTTFQPMLFVRWRRYDETPLKLKVDSVAPAAGSGAGQETSIGKQKLLVTEAGWAMCMRKTVGEQTRMLAMMGAQPTVLQ